MATHSVIKRAVQVTHSANDKRNSVMLKPFFIVGDSRFQGQEYKFCLFVCRQEILAYKFTSINKLKTKTVFYTVPECTGSFGYPYEKWETVAFGSHV